MQEEGKGERMGDRRAVEGVFNVAAVEDLSKGRGSLRVFGR